MTDKSERGGLGGSGKGIGGHHRAYEGRTDEWLTPPGIVHALGEFYAGRHFDLDPCAPDPRPWDTAVRHFTRADDGLAQPWAGRVWMNPPYGQQTPRWLARLAAHGDGIALVFARTETAMFFASVWGKADAVFFFRGRLRFHRPDGSRAKLNAGGPSCLLAYGANNVAAVSTALAGGLIDGRLVPLTRP